MRKGLIFGLVALLTIFAFVMVSCDNGGSSSTPKKVLSGTPTATLADAKVLTYPNTKTINGAYTPGTGEDAVVYKWSYNTSIAAAAPTTGWVDATGTGKDTLTYTADRGGWYQLSVSLPGYATKTASVFVKSDLTPAIQAILEIEADRFERVALEKDAYAIYKFTIPDGKKWSDYSGIKVQYLVDDNNKDTAKRGMRLLGAFTDATTSDQDWYGNGAGKYENGGTTYDTKGEFTVVDYTDYTDYTTYADSIKDTDPVPLVKNTMYVARKASGDDILKTSNNRFQTYIMHNDAGISITPNSWVTVTYNIDGTGAGGDFNSLPSAVAQNGMKDDPDNPGSDIDCSDDGLGNMPDGTYGTLGDGPGDYWVSLGISGDGSGGITEGLTVPDSAFVSWIKNVTLVGKDGTADVLSTGSGLDKQAFAAYIFPIPGAYRSDYAADVDDQNANAMKPVVWPHSLTFEPKDPTAIVPTQTVTVDTAAALALKLVDGSTTNAAVESITGNKYTFTSDGTSAYTTYSNHGFVWAIPETGLLKEGENEFMANDYAQIKVTLKLTTTKNAGAATGWGGAFFSAKADTTGVGTGAWGANIAYNQDILDSEIGDDGKTFTYVTTAFGSAPNNIGFQLNAWGDQNTNIIQEATDFAFTVELAKIEFIPAP